MIKAYTHSGAFHADDVFSAALLKLYFKGNIEFIRVARVPDDVEEGDIVFDIGGGKYDHHQSDSPVRENGVPYAAFGLLWREIGPVLVGPEQAELLDRLIVEPIDSTDNGGPSNPLSALIKAFNPSWDDNTPADECFQNAVECAKTLLEKEINRVNSTTRAEKLVQTALDNAEDPRIVVLEHFAPWQGVLCRDDRPVFVVFPSMRNKGNWNAQVIPARLGDQHRTARKDFPEKWLENKPEGLKFLHKGLFLLEADSKDRAIDLCYQALDL